jgi:hypothetical protein
MARALRIERVGGRYHVTARGNERKAIYRNDSDRVHFLQLLAETTERFAIRIHAYVLMDNHFHLLVETPEANLSRLSSDSTSAIASGLTGDTIVRATCLPAASSRWWWRTTRGGRNWRATSI